MNDGASEKLKFEIRTSFEFEQTSSTYRGVTGGFEITFETYSREFSDLYFDATIAQEP